jgi:hypothetical protein
LKISFSSPEGEYDIKSIVIKGTEKMDDFIVGRRYCTDKCSPGNYTYSIKVSQYLPVQKLWMEFT